MDDLDLGATIKGFSPGQRLFNRYTLVRQLGRGGMGVVWAARDEELGSEIALKFLPEVVATDRSAIEDMKREVRRAIDLAHPHIVKIQHFLTDGRMAAVAMEFVQGDTLSSLRVDQPGQVFAPDKLAPWVVQLCAALDYAHAKARVAHRDLKPANLMVDAAGDLKILDFGIAASLSESVTRVSKQAGSSGTPVYMSPQQMMGEKPAVTDDIYALGATLFELLTGKPPFYSGNIILQVQNRVAPSIAERRVELGVTGEPVPLEWEQTIAACLAKEPQDRPQSAGEVAERLGLGGPQKSAKTESREQKTGDKVEPGLRTGSERVPATAGPRSTSKIPLFTALAVGVITLGWLGWYFGVHAPEQKRLAEIARLEAEGRAAEALKLKKEQERAAAEVRERQERERREAERLANARGGLAIRTNPPGAEMRVGAVALDKSPLTLEDQKLGKYPVRIRLDGYEDWSGEVEVKENEFADLDVVLVRSTGTAAFSSDPPGLEVEVVGRAVPGTPAPAPRQTVRTPVDLKLPTGTYDVILRRSGWPDQKRTIEVTRHQTIAVNAEFMGGTLELYSTPGGAEVWSGGKQVGTTPYRVSEVVPGRHDFELRLKGYKTTATSLTVQPRQLARESATLEKEPHFVIEGLGLEMRHIPPGAFQMGSASGGDSDERPFTRVTLTKPYWLGKTEVTQAQWTAVMGNNPSQFKGDDRPVEQVSWNDAMEFCRKLTERERAAGRLPEGYAYTLPTEAEWEYACRAGTTGDYAGNLDAMGWYGANSGSTTHPVGTKQANAWGLHDMHGNVWEWCADWYGNYPGGSVTDPTGPPSGSYRVLRGGCWFSAAVDCRSAGRSENGPGLRSLIIGFRLALVPAP